MAEDVRTRTAQQKCRTAFGQAREQHPSKRRWDGAADPALAPLRLVVPGARLGRPPRHLLSNSFAFGGNNACLLLSAE